MICTSISTDLHILMWEFRLSSLGLWSHYLVIENAFLPSNHTNLLLIIIDIGKGMSLQLQHKPCTVYSDNNGNNLVFVCYTGCCHCQVQDTRLDALIISLNSKRSFLVMYIIIVSWFNCLSSERFSQLFASWIAGCYLVAKPYLHKYCSCLYWN